MTRTICIQAGPEDYESLLEFIHSCGLQVLPPSLDMLDEDGNDPGLHDPSGQLTFLSPQPVSELHPYGDPPVQIAPGIDPMLDFIRPYYDPNHAVLVQGYIRWHGKGRGMGPTFDQEVGSVIQPYFGKLERWIRKHWKKRNDICKFWWIGPQAEDMIDNQGVKPMSFAPGSTILKVWTDPDTGEAYVIDEVDAETGDW